MPATVAAVACLTLLAAVEPAASQGSDGRMKFFPPPNSFLEDQNPKLSWFNQLVDHFGNNSDMWRQRFYYNGKHYKQGGPVYLFIGGEFPMKPSFVGAGHIAEMAKQNNAFIFGLEHRYYGTSFPTRMVRLEESLAPQSSAQALADLARFIETIARRSEFTSLAGARWLLFGCSYPGMLAAWFRLLYPHLAYAAVASSAPVLAQVEFPEYEDHVAKVLQNTKPGCLDNIKSACASVRDLQKNNNSAKLDELFPDTVGDPVTVVNYLISALAQGNYQILGRPIKNVCTFMTNEALGSPLQRYSALWKHYKDFNDESALNGLEFISWRYQTCTEFGYQFVTNDTKYPFRNKTLEDHIKEECSIFGSKFDKESLYAAVEGTNTKYGGKSPNVTRVIFTNGGDDPWSPLGITSNPPPGDNHVIVIPGEPHCSDFLPSSSKDSPDMTKARKQIQALVKKWSNTTNKCIVPGMDNWLTC